MATATASQNWSNQFRSHFEEIEVNPLEEGATALMYACQQEHVEDLQTILDRKPEAIRERDRTLKTVLHYCAENVTLRCAEIVLNAAPDLVDLADEDGYTTLHLAVIAGNIPLVNFLISKSADINALDAEQHSVIHWATVCGEVELLEILLKCSADPSTPDVHGGYPIHYAAQMCGAVSEMSNDSKLGLAVLKVLINNQVDVNVVDRDGRQPVLWAASAGSSDAVIALINAGASVRAHDKDGLTALHCAASRGHTECLETLIELCAADVDVIDNNGCSPLFYSTTLGHADATQLLLQYGANPNRQDRKGRTPAHCGATKGQLETLKILKEHNGNLWIKNLKGDYCLHEAVSSGRKDLVKWLLAQRADSVNAPNSDGRCPLHIAAGSNNIEMCKILLDYQSLVNPVMRTHKGDLMTPLDAALHKGNRGCAKYLQLHGGVPSTKLTSSSAAIRGPHRIEAHSDYQGSPEGKLGAPCQTRSSRSLDTSPLGYQSKSRKVQVCIRADVSSENIHEAFSYLERHPRHRKRCDYEERCNRQGRNDNNEDQRSVNSNSESSTDVTEYSSGNNFKSHRRRRRRRQYSNRRTRSRTKKPRSRSQSCCRCSADEKSKNEDKNETKVSFQKERKEEWKKDESTKNFEGSIQHTVTAMVHREDEVTEALTTDRKPSEEQKPSESSESGVQEIQYQKLDTDTDVISEEKKPEENVKGVEHPSTLGKSDQDKPKLSTDSVKTPHEDAKSEIDIKTKKESETSSTDIVVPTSKQNDITGVTPTAKSSKENETAVSDSSSAPKINKENEDSGTVSAAITTDTGTGAASVEIASPGASVTWSDLKDPKEALTPKLISSPNGDTDDIVTIRPIPITDADGGNIQINRPQSLPLTESTTNTFRDADSTSVTKSSIESPTAFNRLPENVQKSIEELEKFKGDKLEEHFVKDKGLICVILDDDETIEIKRRRDTNRSKSEHHPRTKSATRKKEKNLQRRQRRSRSSFEILSDDANEAFSSRLTVQDDSGFEPSPRHSGQAKFEDVSNKSKSRIPRATNRYQSDKQKENEPDINVTSVTQAVQNSLRKYHLERKVFHTLLELKRLQIRAGKSNEQVLVKRLVDDYQKAGLIVGLRPYDGVYSFRHFERYLYEQLRVLQSANKKDIPRIKSSDDFERLTKALHRTRAGKTLLENVPDNPLFCTHGTHRCIHATHAYTGIPCAAYIAKLDHHKLPKPNENYRCFLPRIDNRNVQRKNPEEIAKSLKNVDPSKPVTLELTHGSEKQIISLPTEKLDKNKRYYVTFTIEGSNNQDKMSPEENDSCSNGTHSNENITDE